MSEDRASAEAVQLIEAVMGAFSEGDLDRLVDMLHDDVVVEMPYETGHGVDVLDKAGFREVLDLVQSMYEHFTIVFDRILPLEGGAVVVGEHHGDAAFKGSGVTYANRYCGIFMTEGAKVVHWREYDNPLILASSLEAHFKAPSQPA